jgi:hypothetical protein
MTRSDARDKHSRVDVQFAGKKPPCHRQCWCIDVCMQAAQRRTPVPACSMQQPCMVSIAISICMFYSSIPLPPSLSLSSPYSKNAGAEFVSKIDLGLATVGLQYTHDVLMYTATVQNKVPDIAMHTSVVYILDFEELYLSIIPPSVHQMHTNVLLCHLGVSPLNHFPINTM